MKFLLDTHVMLWSAENSKRLSAKTMKLLQDDENELFFSVVSFWEISIKRALGRKDFYAEPRQLRHGLLGNGYRELQVTSEHAFTVETLPLIHRDPFDRMLIAQAMVEGAVLLTVDSIILRYPGPIQKV
ncbi:MAG TPA: type II toxin-antitoxin system VapC family toxin [Acidobacteriaceae bacterium]|jgi:PIN domain nuclease of toxin-antitoxin system|nr:type II toxin-antitoxin system VapC family toxin [Acidobacteriaceae bacterium]